MTTAREQTNEMASMLQRERGGLADFLLAFSEFHAKRRWRELGYGSAFPYLRGEFKLSEGAAYNRIVAAELVDRVPEVEAAVRSGDLCFSTVNQVAKVLTPENKDELLPRFLHLSRRQAEQLAVSLRPVEVIPVREVVTAIRPPAAARAGAAVTPPAAAAGETLPGGTDGSRLHPGEVAAEVDGSPAADGSAFQLHPGSRPDTSVTVRPETWVTLAAHALGTNRPDDRATAFRHRAAQAQVELQERLCGLRDRAEDRLQVVAPVRSGRAYRARGSFPPP
jgi:hypothetical protein